MTPTRPKLPRQDAHRRDDPRNCHCVLRPPPSRTTRGHHHRQRPARRLRDRTVSAPLLFSANDCLDIGTCLGSPVSLDYYDRAPFPFNGHIDTVSVRYLT